MRRGFTIIELLVVVLIISMLAVFIVPRFIGKIGRAKSSIASSKMSIIVAAISLFTVDCERVPTQDEGLDALLEEPSDLEEDIWDGPYLKASELKDPWGNMYVYIEEGTVSAGSYDLISLGADGQEGGEGDKADIYYE